MTTQAHSAPLKPKRRTKAAKILFLRRSAAAKAKHHRKRHRDLAHRHGLILLVLVFVVMYIVSIFVARATDLIPPPGKNIDISAYEKIAAAKRAPSVAPPDQVGRASWYALGLGAPDALTCASTTYPRGSQLLVTDLRNGKQVTCLVNDYGPAKFTGRVVDLSRGSYSALEGLGSGTMPVEIRLLKPSA